MKCGKIQAKVSSPPSGSPGDDITWGKIQLPENLRAKAHVMAEICECISKSNPAPKQCELTDPNTEHTRGDKMRRVGWLYLHVQQKWIAVFSPKTTDG